MILRHLRTRFDKGRDESDKRTISAAYLEFADGRIFPIDKVVTIGRAPDCQVMVNERSVSRHHARVFCESEHYWLKDLESANGTTHNGKTVKLQMLSDNDKIGFGDAKAVFHAAGQSGPAAIGSDPLEGVDDLAQDGTPTAGLPPSGASSKASTADYVINRQSPDDQEHIRRRLEQKEKEVESLKSEIQALREGNRSLHTMLELQKKTGVELPLASSVSATSESLQRENERLRILTKQLEKALADVNLRFRNLQELFDRKNDGASKRS
jgi:pSer/pThr/pTyr-binding forkhead associated (FHA) protein